MMIKGQSWKEYCELKHLNGSTLVSGRKSMRALKRAIDSGGKEQTDAMRFGSGVHCLLLEPTEFEHRYCVLPDFHLDPGNVTQQGKPTDSKVTTYYKQRVKDFAAENAGREFITRAKYDEALYCIESIRSKPKAAKLLDDCGANKELTLTGEIDGVPIRGRIDALATTCVVDLKTTASADPRTFGRTFASLHYGFKLAIYRELVRQSTGHDRDVVVIAQENCGDFDTVVYEVPEAVLDNGLIQVQRVIRDYKHAVETGQWNGIDRGEDTVPLLVPNWAMEDAGEELVQWSSEPISISSDELEVHF